MSSRRRARSGPGREGGSALLRVLESKNVFVAFSAEAMMSMFCAAGRWCLLQLEPSKPQAEKIQPLLLNAELNEEEAAGLVGCA